MSTLYIHYHLYGSNPIIARSCAIPEGFSLSDLTELCGFTMGFTLSDCYSEVHPDPDSPNYDDGKPGILRAGMTGYIRLANDSKAANLLFLDIFWSVSEGYEESPAYPVLKSWMGYQLPCGIFNISIINEMQSAFLKSTDFQTPSGEMLYRDQLTFAPKKAENAIYKKYAPDRAQLELKTEFGIPVSELLESISLPDLKKKLDQLHCYGFATKKKAECVIGLAKKLDQISIDWLFDEMEMKEYLNFRQLLLSGTTSSQNNEELEQEFPVLYSAFMIRFIKKQGVRIYKEVIQNYEEWFDQPSELQFRKDKRMRQAMRWCNFYYGIFSMEDCLNVLQSVYPGEITKEDMTAYWENNPEDFSAESISFTGSSDQKRSVNDYAYDIRVISYGELALYLEALKDDKSKRKLPENPENFEETAGNNLLFLKGNKQINDILEDNGHFYDKDYTLACLDKGVMLMRGGVPADGAAEKILKDYRWRFGSREDMQTFKSCLKLVESSVPRFLYYGFTEEEIKKLNLVSGLKVNYEALKKKQEELKKEQEKLKKQERAMLKKTRPAKTPVKRGRR